MLLACGVTRMLVIEVPHPAAAFVIAAMLLMLLLLLLLPL
jgi:hypothetical protein